MKSFDVLIVGGGLVGATLALGLGQLGLSVALVEAHSVTPDATVEKGFFDDRSIALSHGTRNILSRLGLWKDFASQVTPIHKIHISDRGHFGFARLCAKQEQVPALGYVIESRVMGSILQSKIPQSKGITFFCPWKLASLTIGDDCVSAQLEQEAVTQTIEAKLLLVADGAHSHTRDLLGVAHQQVDFGQTAVIANVSVNQSHKNTAYERFTETGPLALLPFGENRCALVWTVRAAQAEQMLQWDDAFFLEKLQQQFGSRLGRLQQIGKRSLFPLEMIRVSQTVGNRWVIIGNAAHTLHPVAGQGFNLGMRDIDRLTRVLAARDRFEQNIAHPELLAWYQQQCKPDYQQMQWITEGLVQTFSHSFAPVVLLRDAGLLGLDFLPMAKHWLAGKMMGFPAGSQALPRKEKLA